MAEVQSFNSIKLDKREGSLKLGDTGIQFKDRLGNMTSLKLPDVKTVQWIVVSNTATFALAGNNFSHRFSGFRHQDKDTLSNFCKNNFESVDFEEVSLCATGLSWGEVNIDGNHLNFKAKGQPKKNLDGQHVLDFSLQQIEKVTMSNDNVLMEFYHDDTELGKEDDQITEMKLYVPKQSNYNEGDDSKTPAEALHQLIQAKANITELGDEGGGVVGFEQVFVHAPRGRFDIELYPQYFTMRGLSGEHKVLYSNLAKLFYMPKPDGVHHLILLNLVSPIRKGATSYFNIVLQLDSQLDREVELNISEELLEKHDKLTKEMAAKEPQLLGQILASLSGIKLHKPAKSFSSEDSKKAVSCNLKTHNGHLFPMEKFFVFAPKNPAIIKLEEINSVSFARHGGGGGSSHSFDLHVTLKNRTTHEFTGVPRGEYNPLFDFFSDKRITVENIQQDAQAQMLAESSEDDTPMPRADEDGPLDSESEDDDFEPEAKSESSAGEESDDEDGEGDGSGSDNDSPAKEAPMKKEKPQKKEKVVKAKKAAGSPEVKKAKKTKDKNAPKGAKGAYMYFCEANRATAQEENPEMKMTELSKVLGAKWQALSAEEKEPYNEKAATDKERAKTEKAAYAEQHAGQDDEDAPKKKTKRKKDPNAPKGAATSFMLFANATRPQLKEENSALSVPELGKALGVKWKELADDEKEAWKEKAAGDKVRYDREMAEYKEYKANNPDLAASPPKKKQKSKAAPKPSKKEEVDSGSEPSDVSDVSDVED